MKKNNHFKIVITGGPGGGKTTALDLFQRELRTEVKIIPEAATTLFSRGLNRERTPERMKLLQCSIYKMQINLEDIYHNLYSDRLLVCDRGALDGLAYWPEDENSFFESIGSSLEKEIARYDAVIFFQTAASVNEDIESNNPYRSEDSRAATLLDEKLKKVWEQHPNFHYIPTSSSFMLKIAHGLITIQGVLEEMRKR
ncbi:AAA family ATPase [Bdellovibrio svalbardensis]|uniref:ATP-binding protein n=1 Tax=Bdellovibrio svalbardensis TaxID=2972972 RepID=A0ABT6DF71_9BACT|nr:AAA family ATPase [Bdellovibrio svalbardensis]MDG0815154.1 ATP-binding protein [Bdellovibrio svalbardensis]